MSMIDQHLKKFSGEQLATLQHLRETIRSIVPQANETMSYGMPAFEIDGKVVAGFEGFKKHCSYFPHSGSVLEQISPIPEWCEVSKGTLKFPIGKKLPKTLVRKMISVRKSEISVKQRNRQPLDGEWIHLGLAAPARRALVNKKILELHHLGRYSRKSIAELHGMGPNAMKILEKAMRQKEITFRSRA
jgi:uncharacterized protein YdhG (YjbR/CyaY superfamily)